MTWAYHAWPAVHCSAFESALAIVDARGGLVCRAFDSRDGMWAEFEVEGARYRLSVVRLGGESNVSTGDRS